MKNQTNERELNQRMLLLGILSGLVVVGGTIGILWHFAPSWFEKEKANETAVVTPPLLVPRILPPVTTPTPSPKAEPIAPHEKLLTAPARHPRPVQKIISEPKAPRIVVTEPVVEIQKHGCAPEEMHAEKNKQFYRYDAADGGPVLYACANILVETSLDADFKSFYINGHADEKGRFKVSNPPPGTLYWRVDGDSEAHKLVILDAQPLRIKVQPTLNLKQGDRISWNADENASFYRVEVFSEASLVSRTKMFSTKNTSIDPKLLGAEHAFIRVGALNLKRGVMEFTEIQEVSLAP